MSLFVDLACWIVRLESGVLVELLVPAKLVPEAAVLKGTETVKLLPTSGNISTSGKDIF